MDRRTLLKGLGSILMLGKGTASAAEGRMFLPTAVPGRPDILVSHEHFAEDRYPVLEEENGHTVIVPLYPVLEEENGHTVIVPFFHLHSSGMVLPWRRRQFSAPLSDTGVVRGIAEQMRFAAIAAGDKEKRMVLVTHCRDPHGIGLCLSVRQLRKYGDWL
jgi:hypothetical protein